MRICLVSREFPPGPRVGESGAYTHDLGRAMASRGHEVHVITEGQGAEKVVRLEGSLIVHRLARRTGWLASVAARRRALAVESEVRTLPPLDVIQACEDGGEAFFLTRRRVAPVVTRLAWSGAPGGDEGGGRSGGSRPGLAARRMARRQTSTSDLVLVPSRLAGEKVARAWGVAPHKVKIIPAGLDIEGIRALAAARRDPPPPPLSRYVIYYGRLEEARGVHVLAQSLAWVMRGHRDLWAVFVGADRPHAGGSMRGFIEQRMKEVRDRLVLRETLPPARLMPILAGATVAVFPWLTDGAGAVCLEAMSHSVPVVATSVSSLAEYVEHGKTGLLVPPGDSTNLGGRLISFLDDPAELARLGQAGQEKALQYDMKTVCERLERLYEGLNPRSRKSGPKEGSALEFVLGDRI